MKRSPEAVPSSARQVHRRHATMLAGDACWVGANDDDYAAIVAGGGDLDGDGFDDLAIGVPLLDEVAENAGAIFIVYGGSP